MSIRIFQILTLAIAIAWLPMCANQTENSNSASPNLKISKEKLLDKIKGGWAGQTIGVTFGWPSEFRYLGTFIQDYEKIKWHEDYVNEAMTVFPGLFDDVYVDLTFVEVFEKLGLDAPLDSFGVAFASKNYELWHANQAGRYNLQQGISADKSGHWLNNPHADDIDFQIEADFAGLMSPGIPATATNISNKLGKLVNSGDGLYGGIYVANLYALAFASNDVSYIVKNALNSIPKESKFYQCIADVIKWHKAYPNDWKQTWFEIQKKWAEEDGCPNGVFHPLNIDAKLNAAYVVVGLLYGEGDFTKTIEIATRQGQDSDCNPATAIGVLGVIKGYSAIPAEWLAPLQKAETRDFSYTNLSLEKVYALSYKHALENLAKNNCDTSLAELTITGQKVEAVEWEENFKGHHPSGFVSHGKSFTDELSFEAEGIGFVIRAHAARKDPAAVHGVINASLFINGEEVERANFPTDPLKSRTELFWRYNLPKGKHLIKIKINDPNPSYEIRTVDCLQYDDKKLVGQR